MPSGIISSFRHPAKEDLDPEAEAKPLISTDWTIEDSFQGTQIFGATGSGKTTGSAREIAYGMLQNGYGGLVLTAKPDEAERWERYAQKFGRSILTFNVGSDLAFNFLNYEYERGMEQPARGSKLTWNLVSLFIAALSSGETPVSSSDPYWNDALRELLTHAIDLVNLAGKRITLTSLAEVVRSAPQNRSDAKARSWRTGSRCWALLEKANARRRELDEERRGDLEGTTSYWLSDFANLAPRTRSIVVSSFTSKATGLLRSPLRRIFCGETNESLKPERTHEGSIIVLDFPVKEYGEVGRFAQVLYKTVWQRATDRRKDAGNASSRPVFLWADEAQYFVTPEDMQFQQTARSARAATVYITQSISNYYAILGGKAAVAGADSLLGNLQTKIFHANGDPTTNEWAERLFGKRWKQRPTTGSGNYSETPSLDPVLPSNVFTTLKMGGKDKTTEAYVFQGGRVWGPKFQNFIKHTFGQEYGEQR